MGTLSTDEILLVSAETVSALASFVPISEFVLGSSDVYRSGPSITASGRWTGSTSAVRISRSVSSLSIGQSSAFTVSKVGEPRLPPPLTSPWSDGGDVKTLLELETELAREGAWDRTFRGLPVGGLRAADRLVLVDPAALD